MFEIIQKRYMTKMIFLAIMCWLMAVLFAVTGASQVALVIKVLTQEPENLNSLNASQIQDGLFVEGEIITPIDSYIYQEKGGAAFSQKYLIAVGEQEYMSLSCSDDTASKLNSNRETLLDAMRSDDPDLVVDIQPVKVRGVIRKLNTKSQEAFQKHMRSAGVTEEEKGLYLEYELVEGRFGDVTLSGLRGMGILILLFMFLGINCIVRGVKRKNLGGLKYYCEQQGDLEYGLFKMEQFYEEGIQEQGLRFNDEFFLMIKGTKAYFAQTKHILWIYPHTTRYRVLFIPIIIPVGKTYSLSVRKIDGTEIRVPVKNKRAMERMLEYISSSVPYVILGYNKDIERVYVRNRGEMIRMVEQRRQEHLGIVAKPMEQPYSPGPTYPTGQSYPPGQSYPLGPTYPTGQSYPMEQPYSPRPTYPTGQSYSTGQPYSTGQSYPTDQPYSSGPTYPTEQSFHENENKYI